MNKRLLLGIAALMVLGCHGSAEEPAGGVSGAWTGLFGKYFTPTAPVFTATLQDVSGIVTGTVSWLDGPYVVVGSHHDSTVVFRATSEQPPTRTWQFSGVVSGRYLIGEVSADGDTTTTTLWKGGTLPP